MCDLGITAIVTSVVATALSTTMGVISSVQQGKSAEAQYNYQAEINRRNAEKAQANADMKRQEGIEEARTQRIKTLQAIGSQQTAMAANGFDVSSGTNLDIIEDSAATGELDALTKQYNKETEAVAYENQADNFNNQANLDTFAGKNAYKAGITNAIGTGLNGLGTVANVAGKWYSDNSIGNKTYRQNTKLVSGGVKGDSITFA